MTIAGATVTGHLKDAVKLGGQNIQTGWKAVSNRVQTEGLFKTAGNIVKDNKLATAGLVLGGVAGISVMHSRHRDKLEQQQQQAQYSRGV